MADLRMAKAHQERLRSSSDNFQDLFPDSEQYNPTSSRFFLALSSFLFVAYVITRIALA